MIEKKWFPERCNAQKQRNSKNCNFFIRIFSRSSWLDHSEFDQYSLFTTVIQDSGMKFVINPMDVLIFFKNKI